MPEGATALEIPSDRPAFLTSLSYGGGPPAATAVFLPRETLTVTGSPATISVYFNFVLDPELEHYWRRLAYAYITPLDLPQNFELLPPEHGADMAVLFRTPDFREAALLRQPFVLDGVTVKLLRDGETPDTIRVSTDYLVHAALRDYPIEQRTEKGIRWNCCRFGYVREIDPACFVAPDLATVRVVLELEHPREIPHELRIDYSDDDGPTSVVPVEIVRVWHHSHSDDANGQYLPLFQSLVAAA
ncbi:hypothetical protein CFC21_080337 [Triticum aestivum]|uniref:Uncharacterized protein n=2 Tax=Triticum aestivum TaxID=4565 RepID=A0A9R1I2H3_WHEAT|nr:hypothetical protein CFC21_080337 [Triticum aestivum]